MYHKSRFRSAEDLFKLTGKNPKEIRKKAKGD